MYTCCSWLKIENHWVTITNGQKQKDVYFTYLFLSTVEILKI